MKLFNKRNILFTALLFFAIPGVLSAQDLSAQEIAQRAFDTTVLLVMEDANGQQISLGSGFFVRAGEIVSNLHVVEGAARGYAKRVGSIHKLSIEGVIAVDPERDLVILKSERLLVFVEGVQEDVRLWVPESQLHRFKKEVAREGAKVRLIDDPEDRSYLPLGSSETVQVGESVYAVGNPQGLEGTFSQGIVSSIRQIETVTMLQITAPISPGSSGGPVLNAKGEVIGVSVATFSSGQNLNFAIPVDYLKPLLDRTGDVKPLAQAQPSRARRLMSPGLTDADAGSVVGGSFAWSDRTQTGYYTFSVRNKLQHAVRDVTCLIIFYGRDGLPIETETHVIPGPIHGGTAKRSRRLGRGAYQQDQVRNLTERVEIRVLDFRLVGAAAFDPKAFLKETESLLPREGRPPVEPPDAAFDPDAYLRRRGSGTPTAE